MKGPRAADDFATIRERVGELRHERNQVADDQTNQTLSGPRQYDHRGNGETPPVPRIRGPRINPPAPRAS
jgi:hypothetical protein